MVWNGGSISIFHLKRRNEKRIANKTVGHRPPEKAGQAGQLPTRWMGNKIISHLLKPAFALTLLSLPVQSTAGTILDAERGQA